MSSYATSVRYRGSRWMNAMGVALAAFGPASVYAQPTVEERLPAEAASVADEAADAGEAVDSDAGEVVDGVDTKQVVVDGEPTDSEPSEVRPSEEVRSARALVQYEAEHYADSARTFTGLWSEFKAAKYLYNIAAAHEVLRHDSFAYVYYRRYLVAPDRMADKTAMALRRIEALRGRAQMLRLQFKPGTDLSATRISIHYRSLQGLADPARPPLHLKADELEKSDRPGELLIYVERGLWGVTTEIEGHTLGTSVEVTEENTKASVDVERLAAAAASVRRPIIKDPGKIKFVDPTRSAEQLDEIAAERSSRRMAQVFGGVGALSLAGGAGLLAYSSVRWNTHLEDLLVDSSNIHTNDFNKVAWERADGVMFRGWLSESFGAGLIGGGAGLTITALISNGPRRVRSWVAPLLVGGVLSAGGLFGVAMFHGSFDTRTEGLIDEEAEPFELNSAEHRRLRHAYQQDRLGLVFTSAGAGIGAGLIVGSVIAILQSSARRGRSPRGIVVRPQFGGSGASLSIEGRF